MSYCEVTLHLSRKGYRQMETVKNLIIGFGKAGKTLAFF